MACDGFQFEYKVPNPYDAKEGASVYVLAIAETKDAALKLSQELVGSSHRPQHLSYGQQILEDGRKRGIADGTATILR